MNVPVTKAVADAIEKEPNVRRALFAYHGVPYQHTIEALVRGVEPPWSFSKSWLGELK